MWGGFWENPENFPGCASPRDPPPLPRPCEGPLAVARLPADSDCPPGCRMRWHCLPAAEFRGGLAPPPGCRMLCHCLRWRFLQQLCAHKKVMENYFPGNVARLASTRVGWFLLKFPCRGTPRDPPPFPPALRAPPAGWRGARPAADSDTRGNGLPGFTAGWRGARGLPGTACAAEPGCGVAMPTVPDSPLLSSADMACYSRPLVPPSSGKFTGQRGELCARGLDGRATRRAISAGHTEKWGALSPMNLVP